MQAAIAEFQRLAAPHSLSLFNLLAEAAQAAALSGSASLAQDLAGQAFALRSELRLVDHPQWRMRDNVARLETQIAAR